MFSSTIPFFGSHPKSLDLEIIRLSCIASEHEKTYSFMDIYDMFDRTRSIATPEKIQKLINTTKEKAYNLLKLIPKQILDTYPKISEMNEKQREKKRQTDYKTFIDRFIHSELIDHLEKLRANQPDNASNMIDSDLLTNLKKIRADYTPTPASEFKCK